MPAVTQIASAVVIVTPPEAPDDLVMTVDALKRNCGFATSDTDFDDVFRDLILDATDYVEEAARTFMRPVTVDEQFEYCPAGTGAFRLSRCPVRAITSVTYVDTEGDTQTLASTAYSAWLAHNPPLVGAVTNAWPSTKPGIMPAATIRYTAGPETVDAATISRGLYRAVMLIATATYQNGDGRERSGPLVIPDAATAMILATAKRGL